MTSELKHVTIYTDGGCSGNPGPGGYGAIIIYKDKIRELSAGYRLTTNNRMELMAAIAALSALKEPCFVTLHTDSLYLKDGIMKGWALKWRSKNWMKNKNEKALNPDLWERLLQLMEIHKVDIKWVRGHTGHKENERCDQLCKIAFGSGNLITDEGYCPKSEIIQL